MRQRAELIERIGTLQLTIAGLAKLFGVGILSDDVMRMLGYKYVNRKTGLTRACRMILMESLRPISTRDIYDHFQERMPTLLTGHKDPLASLITVLNRLVRYGEAKAVLSAEGKRQWIWAIEDGPEVPSKMTQA
jgi:hypothetical protein